MSAATDQYVDGFLRYDAFPQNAFAQRDLAVSFPTPVVLN